MHDFSVLVAVALPSSGPKLLRVARLLAPSPQFRLTALHCRADGDEFIADSNEDDPLGPLLLEAGNDDVNPVYLYMDDLDESILAVAREREANLILMGWHRPMVPDGEPDGPIRGVLERSECDVGILLSRHFRPVRRVLAPFHGGRHDRRALEFAARIARTQDVVATVLHVVTPERPASSAGPSLSETVDSFSDGQIQLKVVESADPIEAAIREARTGYDMIVAGASEVWATDFSPFPERLQQLAFATPASLLVVHSSCPLVADEKVPWAATGELGPSPRSYRHRRLNSR